MTYLDQEREEKMKTMANPQPFRISRTVKLTLPRATTLLLAVVVVLLVAATPRPAQALLPGGMNMYPVVSVKTPSVVVTEGQPATNSGTFYDPADPDRGIKANFVSIKASVGHITQSGGIDENGFYSGTWSWSMPTDEWTTVAGDLNKTVTITATDSRGATSSRSFPLTVKNGPPANDSFSSARDLATVGPSSTTISDTILATMEAGEPRPSSPTKDCGIYGHDKSVWFKFTYGGQGGFPPLRAPNAYYNFDTQGTNFDSVLALYEGSSLGTLNQIECSNDNSLPNWNDNLRLPQSKLTVGKTYYVQLTGTGGARSGKYQLHYEPRGLTQPKVMAYNIAEGTNRGGLPAVASTIKALRPDIVLLNEVRNYTWNLDPTLIPPHGVWDQAQWLAAETGFRYYKYHHTTLTGIHGTKGVAILSRYPITSTNYTPILDQYGGGGDSHYGILKATIPIDGLTHHVFSTRFNHEIEWENQAGHKMAIGQAQLVPSTDAVIIGGDFNAPWSQRPWAKEIWDRSGLNDAYGAAGLLSTLEDPYNRKDYIYYRGPYSVYQHQQRSSESLGLPPASDHMFAFSHFLRDY